MYRRYADLKRWRFSVTDYHETGLGGLKEAVAVIEGERVFSRLKYESGVHRVQRVPETEAQEQFVLQWLDGRTAAARRPVAYGAAASSRADRLRQILA